MELLDDCEFIAIFDADFKPELEFLVRLHDTGTRRTQQSKDIACFCCQACTAPRVNLQSASRRGCSDVCAWRRVRPLGV